MDGGNDGTTMGGSVDHDASQAGQGLGSSPALRGIAHCRMPEHGPPVRPADGGPEGSGFVHCLPFVGEGIARAPEPSLSRQKDLEEIGALVADTIGVWSSCASMPSRTRCPRTMADNLLPLDGVVVSKPGSGEHPSNALPWDHFYKELLERNYDGVRERLVAIQDEHPGGVDIDRVDEAIEVIVGAGLEANSDRVDADSDLVGATNDLAQGIEDAVLSPHRAVLLVAYLYARYLRIWEDTSNWGGIRRVIGVTSRAVEAWDKCPEKRSHGENFGAPDPAVDPCD